jgi:hypothetical protein
MSFKKFIINEIADFGFERKLAEPFLSDDDDKPIDPIESERIIAELYRYKIGNKVPELLWHDVIAWGESVGAIKLDISPLGSYKAIVRRMIKDLQGNSRWICEFVYNFNETGNDKNEIDLALKIHEQLDIIDKVMLPAPSEKFPELQKLVFKLAGQAKANTPEVMNYVGIKQMEENYYQIYFDYKGHGVEAPGGRRGEQFNIDIQFVESAGLIRCWGYEISSPTKGRKWELMPSEWDEVFAPNQKLEDITFAVVQALKTY